MFPRCPLGGRSAPGVPTSPLSALRDGEYTPEFTEETEPRGGRQLVSPRDRKRENLGPRRRGHSASQASSPLDVEWRKRVISPSRNCRGPVGVQTAQGILIKPRGSASPGLKCVGDGKAHRLRGEWFMPGQLCRNAQAPPCTRALPSTRLPQTLPVWLDTTSRRKRSRQRLLRGHVHLAPVLGGAELPSSPVTHKPPWALLPLLKLVLGRETLHVPILHLANFYSSFIPQLRGRLLQEAFPDHFPVEPEWAGCRLWVSTCRQCSHHGVARVLLDFQWGPQGRAQLGAVTSALTKLHPGSQTPSSGFLSAA